MEIIDYLRIFNDWISSNVFITIVIIPIVTSIIGTFIYDIFKKEDVLVAEESIYNSLRNFIKEDKIPDPNYIETLIEATAEKYRIYVADLPVASSFIQNLIEEIIKNPLFNDDDWKNRVRYQLEWLKQRCKKPCYWKPLKHIEKWTGRLLWTIIFALIWYFIIIMPFEHLNYTPNFVFSVSIVLFIAFIELSIVGFLIYNQRAEEIKYEEIVKAWERYKDKGMGKAKNKRYESAVRYFWQAIETYPAKRTEEYDCSDLSPYTKRDPRKLDEERIEEALDLGELYILFGENLMNLGEERYDEAIYYFKKGLSIFGKRVQSVYVINSKKRNEQIKNIMNASIPFVENFAKIDDRREFEDVVKITKKFACLCQYDYFDKLKEKLKHNAKYLEILEQIRNS